MALAMHMAARPLPFPGLAIEPSQCTRYTVRVNGVRNGGRFDRLLDAIEAIRGRPLGNNYEIFADDKRIFTFGVCLRSAGDIALSSSRRRRSLSELS